jgi:PadR family transcriptional regulator, regulatory protein AphA
MPTRNTPPPPGSSSHGEPAARLPVTAFAVLGQVAAGASTGYQVRARLVAGAAHFWHASYSQIYAELRRLEELGYVGEERVVQEKRPNKRVYTITPAGRQALRSWLVQPWGLAHLRDESLVKLTLADVLPEAEVVAQLRSLKTAHESRMAEFEAQIASLPEDSSPYLRLALRKGVHAQAAFAQWCQEAIETIGSP